MKSFNQFLTICEAIYDRDKKSDVDLEVGKIGKERKKTTPERRRTKAAGGGKTAPAKEYKPRKDIGKQRQASTRVQQPEKARGSAALSPREQQRKAAQERRASKSGSQGKKDLEKAGSQLLSKKPAGHVEAGRKRKLVKKDPNYKSPKASGYTTGERQKITRAGERLVKDIKKKKEKPASSYDPGVRKG